MKVLITSVSAGSGHVRAAEAIQAAYWRSQPDVKAIHIDVMNFVSPSFSRLYAGGYSFAVNRAPALWGQLYSFWDRTPPEKRIAEWMRRAQRHFSAPFFRYLSCVQPDLILTTHFLVPQLLGQDHPFPWLRRIPIECVITDYDVHQFWISDNISRYYVAHEELADRLMAHGVPSSRIAVTGIPVHPVFSSTVSDALVRQKLCLDPVKPVLLVLAGGLGLPMLEKSVEQLFRLDRPVQILTVAGKNEALRERLNRLTPPPHIRLVNQGYVRNMDELLSISDLVITKPGGLTLSECLAKRRPMLLYAPIPGQEERNSEFALRHHIGLRATAPQELPRLVEKILSDPLEKARFQVNLAACAHPDAAFRIAELSKQDSMAAA
jgi:processive 1,2-diacylglycerol beta-glucosyltransferase